MTVFDEGGAHDLVRGMLDAAMIPLTDSFIELMRALISAVDGVIFMVIGYIAVQGGKHAYRYSNVSVFSVAFVREIFEGYGRLILVSLLLLTMTLAVRFSLPLVSRPVLRVALGVPIIVTCSGILFWLKLRRLRLYALIEGGFALAVCIQTLAGMGDEISPAQIAGLFASAYLFIRAGDNFNKDLKKRNEIKASMPKPPPKYDIFNPMPMGPSRWWQRLLG